MVSSNNVTISTNLNTAPYYDDFDESKNFHRILFRPGLAVQARELTQLQSILQNQIDRFASHIFKEGSIVSGCEIHLDREIYYIKLRDNNVSGEAVQLEQYLGKTITGSNQKVKALVVDYGVGAEANTPNFKTLFVKYMSGNTSGTNYFANAEMITASGGLTANLISLSAGGIGSRITVTEGIIYSKDHFIRADAQNLVLERYSAYPTYRVGYIVDESIINEADDNTLLDPASGAYNYAAPGASRFKIYPILSKKFFSSATSNNFVELIGIKNGIIQNQSIKPEYSAIKDYMAQRTRDESGDYVVRGLQTRLLPHLDSGNNHGIFISSRGGNTSLIGINIDPGKAYVKGYDIETITTSTISLEKGIDYKIVSSGSILADYGNYVYVKNVMGKWDINGQGIVSLRSANTANSGIATVNGGAGGGTMAMPGSQIGTARIKGIERYTGTGGTREAVYKLYLTDIKITAANRSFANVMSVCFSSGSALANTSLTTGRSDICSELGAKATGKSANTTDPSYDYSVFKIPAKALKRIRDTSGNITTDFSFYKSFDISFSTAGTSSVDTSVASETFSGSIGALSSTQKKEYYIVSRGTANTANLTGTVTITSGSASVTGSGTAFTTQLVPGDIISTTAAGHHVVKSIGSATALTLEVVAAATTSGAYHKRYLPGQVLDFSGDTNTQQRTMTLSSTTVMALDIKTSPSVALNATIICKLNKANGREAAKTVNRSRLVEIRCGTGGGYTANTTGPWPLGSSDGFKLISVRQKTSSPTRFASLAEGTDVTSHFTLDSGMTDNFYDHAKLVKKSTSGLTISTNDRFLVKFDYFTHSSSSGVGYLTVDSYPVNDSAANTATIFTQEIPLFTSSADGITYDLRDCIDIRPRITDTANTVTAIANISTNPAKSVAFDEPSGGLHTIPSQSNFTIDYEYYLKRKDAIVLNSSGVFSSVRGIPSLFPTTPNIKDDVMHMATISIAAYPSLSADEGRLYKRADISCSIVPIKNERFTMKDIAAIRDRIDHLEYYTSLSMLEKDAKAIPIADATGVDRFKNGILVDSFSGHGVGNVHDLDYKISIDPKAGEGRPPFKMDNIPVHYNAANSVNVVRTNFTTTGYCRDQVVFISNSQVKFSNGSTITNGSSTASLRYQVNNKLYLEDCSYLFSNTAPVTSGAKSSSVVAVGVDNAPGSLITLPYNHGVMGQQKYATTTRNLAGSTYSFKGQMKLFPDNDTWVDTINRPDVQVNFDLNTDAFVHMAAGSWGTDWGVWNKTITGSVAKPPTERTTNLTTTANGNKGQDVVQSYVTEQAVLVTEQNTRSGIKTTVTPKTTTQNISGLVKDVNIQPFMRARRIEFRSTAMKPNTKLYAYFDGVDVTRYVRPVSSSVYPAEFTTVAQATATNAAKLTFATPTGPTGVQPALGRLTEDGNVGDAFYSNANGIAVGVFYLPNDNSLKFRTGSKIFRLTDSPTNSSIKGTLLTSAEATYTAEGLTTGTQDTVISTRQPTFNYSGVSESFTGTTEKTNITGTGTRVTGTIRDGATGSTGATGATGATGPAGEKGEEGIQGREGAKGVQGVEGQAGATGETGAQGSAGIQGIAGAAGPEGIPGANGIPGATGATGETGPAGAKGEQGYEGQTGASGAPGSQGPAGIAADAAAIAAIVLSEINNTVIQIAVAAWTPENNDGDGGDNS